MFETVELIESLGVSDERGSIFDLVGFASFDLT
jgi:hypothetical protein